MSIVKEKKAINFDQWTDWLSSKMVDKYRFSLNLKLNKKTKTKKHHLKKKDDG